MPATLKVGVLNDTADLLDDDGEADVTTWLEREVAAVRREGRLDAAVEFVHAYGLGLPSGTAEAVERAYRQLAEQGVALIVGPAIGDNALVATPLAEQLRIPTINSGAADGARGRYMFHHQAGSARDEAAVITARLASLGCRRLGVLYDQSAPAMRQLSALRDAAVPRTGAQDAHSPLEVASQGLPAEDAAQTDAAMAALLAHGLDAIVYLGVGTSAPAVARSLAAAGWEGPRMMNAAGQRGACDPAFAAACEGWLYIDRHSDDNAALRHLRAELGGAAGPAHADARGHDLGRLVAEGLARAPELTREGVRAGLEQVRDVPAAQGYDGTMLGFEARNRAALHGCPLVVRQWRGGASLQTDAPTPTLHEPGPAIAVHPGAR